MPLTRISQNQVKFVGRAFSPTEATWLQKVSNMRNEQIRMRALMADVKMPGLCMPETFVGYAPSGNWPNDEGWRPVLWPGDREVDVDVDVDERPLRRSFP